MRNIHLSMSPTLKKTKTLLQSKEKKQVNTTADHEDIKSVLHVLGHAPKLMVLWLTFLKRQTNFSKVITKGKLVNSKASYGLEIRCEYYFHGDT